MVNQFYPGVLLIVETSGKKVIVHKDIDALCLEILKIIEFQILARSIIERRQ
jgi:hypothetical protein